MQINTRTRTVRMTKSETDRIKDAQYIIAHLKREVSALELEDNDAVTGLATAEFQLERAADVYGWKEKVTNGKKEEKKAPAA